jgi:hypothetical protein
MSAINKKESFAGLFVMCIAGRIAPKILPKWGVPVL